MDRLVIPDLDTLRQWLEQLAISSFECDACEALHLPHFQNINGIYDAKVDVIDNVVLFTAVAELKASMLLSVLAEISQYNAASLTMKVFVDIQDDNLPKLVLCQSLSAERGITFEQFSLLLTEAEESTSQLLEDLQVRGFLLGEIEESSLVYSAPSYQLH